MSILDVSGGPAYTSEISKQVDQKVSVFNKITGQLDKRKGSSIYRSCFVKKLFLKNWQYLQENTCVGVSSLIKLQA